MSAQTRIETSLRSLIFEALDGPAGPDDATLPDLRVLAHESAALLAETNPSFRADAFYLSCGLTADGSIPED